MTDALQAHHEAQGTSLTDIDGAPVPSSFGESLNEGCRLLRQEVGLVDLGWRRHLVLTGRHRARFLHNMSTCQVKELTPGEVRFGMTVGRDGKLVADFFLSVSEESLTLESSASNVERILAHLKSHIIADDVQLTPRDDLSVLALVGPGAAEVVTALGADPGDPLTQTIDFDGSVAVMRANDQRLLIPGWDVTCDADRAPAMWQALLSAGATAVGVTAWEAVRVAQGVPRVPVDLGAENIPLESEVLAATIDWDKGCYIGQEVIAMMHYRGRPNRHLVGLRLPDGAELPAPGTQVFSDAGKAVGVTGSALVAPELGGPFALAVVRRKHAIADSPLSLESGGTGSVVLAPFMTSS